MPVPAALAMQSVWDELGAPAATLEEAARDVAYLTARGYSLESAVRFLGDHHQLRKVARDVLLRCLSRPGSAVARRAKRLEDGAVAGRPVVVDAYNVLITVETGLSGGLLVQGIDLAVRDVSRVGGRHRPTDRTEEALDLVARVVARARPAEVAWFVDRPVSRSGELAARLRAWDPGVAVEVFVVPGPDGALVARSGAVAATSDAAVLDRVGGWWDLAAAALGVWGGPLRMVRVQDLGLDPMAREGA